MLCLRQLRAALCRKAAPCSTATQRVERLPGIKLREEKLHQLGVRDVLNLAAIAACASCWHRVHGVKVVAGSADRKPVVRGRVVVDEPKEVRKQGLGQEVVGELDVLRVATAVIGGI